MASVVVQPWRRAFRPNFFPEAQKVILEALQAGNTLSTKDLYRAAVKIPVTLHEVIIPEPIAPSAGKPKEKKAAPQPPTPEHSVRSLSHLKKVIMPSLEQARLVRKVHIRRELTTVELEQRLGTLNKAARKAKTAELAGKEVDQWLWELYPAEKRAAQQEAARLAREAEKRKALEAKTPFGWEVGVGADFSHLSKRRQRRREVNIKREVKWMQKLERVRGEVTPAVDAPATTTV